MTDKWTGQKTVLNKEDVDIIKRLQRGAHPSSSQEMYPVGYHSFSIACLAGRGTFQICLVFLYNNDNNSTLVDISKAPTLWLKALNKHNISHLTYIKIETVSKLTNS